MSVQRGNDQFRRLLQAEQSFVGVQAEVVLECGIDAGQHLDICASGEKLLSRPGEHDHVRIVVHAGFEDCVIELAVHLIGVGIGRRIVQFDHGHAAIDTVVEQWSGGLLGHRLNCGCHNVSLLFNSQPLSSFD